MVRKANHEAKRAGLGHADRPAPQIFPHARPAWPGSRYSTSTTSTEERTPVIRSGPSLETSVNWELALAHLDTVASNTFLPWPNRLLAQLCPGCPSRAASNCRRASESHKQSRSGENGKTPSLIRHVRLLMKIPRSTLDHADREAYIDAVKCLMKLPAKSGSFAPGARSRYEDFVAIHINLTLVIHGTANFRTWHRYFTWTYEQALRNECGYKSWRPGRRLVCLAR